MCNTLERQVNALESNRGSMDYESIQGETSTYVDKCSAMERCGTHLHSCWERLELVYGRIGTNKAADFPGHIFCILCELLEVNEHHTA